MSSDKTKINKNKSLRTTILPTWCPGCFNFQILSGVQNFLENEIKKGKKLDDFAIVSGIGCNSKIFDYLNLPGANTLHGRVPPTCTGIKLAKPKLKVFGFSGDGDAYAEGIEHTIHAARFNTDFTYIVHNNQVFALTLGQPTPVTEKGYIDKSNPSGNFLLPLNPLKLMLSSGASFVARVFANSEQVRDILEKSKNHKGFVFIEIIQPCLIFHHNTYENRFYNLQESGHNKEDLSQAFCKSEEFDYVSVESKIPLGIFYQKERETFQELKLDRRYNGKSKN
ncbi:2-oxoacid:ferredoxin oxidoreductase subunit beta [Patescibacteria group bacterium]|nr:2-oxoacid:ferredoxin oxidoreductase subunit beta [Patescibacteria group bacterium]